MTTPRVSVVIPCHNAEDWIAETIESAIGQSGVLEVIVVDDGSTDQSAAEALRAGGPLVRLLRQPQGGVSRARNVGTAASQGEFVQYLDADDLLTPETLHHRLARLDETGADVAYCDWVRWEEKRAGTFAAGAAVKRTLGPNAELDLLVDHWWPPAALLYRRSLVDRIGGWREDLPIIQDARFLQDAAFVGGRFVHVPEVGARYRVHRGDSLSRRDPRAFLDDCFHNAETIEVRWRAEGTLTEARKTALARVFAYVARATYSIDRDRFKAAVEHVVALVPDFSLDADRPLRALRRVVGFRRAEYVAGWWRQGRAAMRPTR